MIPKDLPKAELHCHLEGTIPPSLAKKIAKRNNVELSANLFPSLLPKTIPLIFLGINIDNKRLNEKIKNLFKLTTIIIL